MFFNSDQVNKKIQQEMEPEKKQGTSHRNGPLYSCNSCRLDQTCKSPKMSFTGFGEKGILFIGQSPGPVEDNKGEQFIGRTGQYLRAVLKSFHFSLDRDGYKDNAIKCFPADNKISGKNVKCCRSFLFENIKELQPKKIILLGQEAVDSVIGNYVDSVGKISRWVGWKIPDQTLKAWIFPVFHPSYVLRQKDEKQYSNSTAPAERLFKQHLKEAIFWDVPFPDYSDDNKKVTIINNLIDAKNYLNKLLLEKPPIIFFDYETTGLKPYRKGHKIICVSISTGPHNAVAFPFFDDSEFQFLFKQLMTCPQIKKAAQNLKYEDTWTNVICKHEIFPWFFDTKTTMHILDNRPKITGLKIRTYMDFGITGYDDDIHPYISAERDEEEMYGKNGFNRMEELFKESPEKVLLYCGFDSMYEFREYEKQLIELEKNSYLMNGVDLFTQGNIELAYVERNGINIDYDYFIKQQEALTKRIDKIDKRINESNEIAVKWHEIHPDTKFNPNSDPQLINLFEKILHYEKVKETDNGNYSVDKNVLEQFDTPFCMDLLNLRRFTKARDTYVVNILKESTDHIVHFFLNLDTARTFRSNSYGPNIQNIPKRDKLLLYLIRSGFIPSPGNFLMEVDYSGIEVRFSACYHKDPVMINYIEDPTTDMHRDEAAQLFMIEKELITKKLRYLAKNEWVFPQFYGSYYKQCAPSLWNSIQNEKLEDGSSVISYLEQNGIMDYYDYEEYVRKCENVFWNEKFKIYTQWKEQTWSEYLETGKVTLLSGFECTGIMRRNNVLNYPIQGTAFHCLLKSLIEVNRFLRKNNFKSKIVAQIHDSIIFDIDPKEAQELIPIIRRIMCEDIRNEWPWIIVPLDIEIECSEINGNWAKMEPISKFYKELH